MTRPVAGLLGVVGLLAALVGVATGLPVAVPAPVPDTAVPVVGRTAVCPDVRQDAGLVSRVTVGIAMLAGATGGSVVLRELDAAGGQAPVPVSRGGDVALDLAGSVSEGGVVVRASGPSAGGLEVEQVTRGPGPAARGLAVLRCAAPTTDAWFVGGSAAGGSATTLVLANPDGADAVVDITAWSAQGPVDQRAGEGVVVPADARTLVPLQDLAPGRDLLAVRVTAVRGRVAPAVRHERAGPAGVDWVPASLPPDRLVVLPGLPQGPGARSVQVTNPGREDAVISLQLTGADGQVAPPELAGLTVPAGSSVTRDLTAETALGALAVAVTSSGPPVLAAALVEDGTGAEVREIAYAGAAGPLSGPALVPEVVVGPSTSSTLLLSALGSDGEVVVTALPLPGTGAPLPSPRTLPVPGGRTVALRLAELLPPGSQTRFAVAVAPAPGSGPVHVARSWQEAVTGGPQRSVTALRSGTVEVTRPAVRADPAAGTRATRPDAPTGP